MNAEAAELLDELGALRRRTRDDRHAYWVPLFLFGALILAASMLYRGSASSPEGVAIEEPAVLRIKGIVVAPLRFFSGPIVTIGDSVAVGVYWLAALVVGLLVTPAWYRWRAGRVGVAPRIGGYLWPTFGALAAFVIVVPAITGILLTPLGGFTKTTFWLSLVVFVAGVGLVVWSTVDPVRPRAKSVPNRITLVAGVALTLVGIAVLGEFISTHGYGALLVIAISMFGLAWMERSPLCAVIAVVFTAASLLSNLYDVENLFGSTDPTMIAAESLALPAVVLIAGGVLAMLTSRRPASAR